LTSFTAGTSTVNPEANKPSRVVVVTGIAGSGKTIAIHALEDLGFYCIDNFPAALLVEFVHGVQGGKIPYKNIALALDTRDPLTVPTLTNLYSLLRTAFDLEVLFLEAAEATVLKRFRETRRKHPLSQIPGDEQDIDSRHLSLRTAILLDIETLRPVRDIATSVVNTTQMTGDYLRKLIRSKYATRIESLEVQVNIISFGFKHGLPQDLDTMFDVRCFKNPHYVEDLRPLTGLDKRIQEFVFSDKGVSAFIQRVSGLLQFLYPLYCQEGKKYFGLGIGCTGGKHRSVAIAEELHRNLKGSIPFVSVEHRDFDKE
jgi:UPF0042 nucleotide-binding protein